MTRAGLCDSAVRFFFIVMPLLVSIDDVSRRPYLVFHLGAIVGFTVRVRT
ncbi:hypothetical protein HMPREF1861_00081 [Corynebacterium kroppenstedtii]|nr:hypothetical protein HMPREF1861_00081 [Corynebacterium kroppenstedtii]